VPGADPVAIQASLGGALAETGITCDLHAYDYQRGFIAQNAEPLLEALRNAHKRVMGGELRHAGSIVHSMCAIQMRSTKLEFRLLATGPALAKRLGAFGDLRAHLGPSPPTTSLRQRRVLR